jgi:signal transduction histidine kinase
MPSADPCKHIRRLLHDLAQPLSVITGTVDLMLLDVDERNPFAGDIQMISQQLEQILEIVAQIRTLAREATGASGYPQGLSPAL